MNVIIFRILKSLDGGTNLCIMMALIKDNIILINYLVLIDLLLYIIIIIIVNTES